jgi:hypothetical protein
MKQPYLYLWYPLFQAQWDRCDHGVPATRYIVLCVCFVDRCLSFCTFSFGHCVVCYSSIYRFWLPLWYLQTLLVPLIYRLGTIFPFSFTVECFTVNAEWRTSISILFKYNLCNINKVRKGALYNLHFHMSWLTDKVQL